MGSTKGRERKMIQRTKIHMLKWMLGIWKLDKVANVTERVKVRFACVSEKMRDVDFGVATAG